MLTDSHLHLFKEYFDDIDKVINDAKKNKVCRYISNADNITSCHEMLDLSKKYVDVYIALGIHPENVDDDINEFESLLEENINNKKIVAIGEIGLDYYYTKDNKDKQIDLFDKQLNLAEKYNLPVIIHSREATLDTINTLKKHKCSGVIHCFSGSLETAREYIKLGFSIGVGGVMTFKNSKIDNIIKDIPLESIVLETDSPYLTPEPYRKYKNEPKYILTIAEYLANLKGITLEEVMVVTENNINRIYFS